MGILKRDAMNRCLLIDYRKAVVLTPCEGCGDLVDKPGLCYECFRQAEADWMQEVELRDRQDAKEMAR